MGTESTDKLNVFVCYSRVDAAWLERVRVHLKPLSREGQIELWEDTRIKAGQRWREEIRTALARARVAVLLISADFYDSDFIAENELPPLLDAEEERGLVILCVHVGPSRFGRDRVLSKYQSINPPERSVAECSKPRRERVFDDLARRIEELVFTPVAFYIRLAPYRHKLVGEIPKIPTHYIKRSSHFETVRDEILDTMTVGVTMIGARKGTALVGMGGVGKTAGERRQAGARRPQQ